MQQLTTESWPEPQTTDEAVRHIAELIAAGFDDWSSLGDIRVVQNVDLTLFNYTAAAQYNRRWNAYERACRGLVIDTANGYVVARPFDKFFNWGEFGLDASRATTDAPIDYVIEKMDGSLIVAFWHDDRYRAVTRGSFTSPQAVWAEKQLAGHFDDLQACWTLLFEAVYPENRVVVDYGGRAGLYLLAMRHRATGMYAPLDFVRTVASSEEPPFPLPLVYDHLDTVEGIRRALDGMTHNEEGFVAVFEDGSRFKFKSAAYLEMHKAIAGLSFKTAVAAVRDGTVADIRRVIPEELRAEFDGWVDAVDRKVFNTDITVRLAILRAPSGDDRKTFALWVQEQPAWMRPYLYAKRDDRDIRPLIFKLAFRDGGNDGS